MSTKFLSPGWRMPRNANQSKSFNYSFTGAGQVNIASPAEVGITSSYSWWMNRNSATANTAYFYNVVGTAGYGMYFLNSSLIYLRYGDGATYIVLSSTELTNAILQINVWQNWTITRKQVSATAQDIKLYVDGVKVVEVLNTTGLGTLGSSVKQVFGAGSIIKMLDFSVFDYVLSDGAISVGGTATGQVAELYNSGNPINPMALPSPPVAYYPLGTSAWNGNYLAENNAIGDYVFDFANSNIEVDSIGDLFSGITNFSFSGWFNLTSFGSQQVFNILEGSNWKFGINTYNNQLRFNVNPGVAYIANLQNITSTNTWFHYAGVFDGSGASDTDRLKLYINGQPQTVTYSITTPTSFPTLLSTADISIGGTLSPFNGMTGKSSNIKLWTSSLTPSEVETLYNYGSPIRTLANIPQSSSLKAWYKLDASEVYNSTTTEWSIDNNQNPSAYSSSLDFDAASSDYIQINNGSSLTNGFSELTVSIWANFSTAGTSQQQIISKDAATSQRSWILRKLSSGVNFLVSTDGTSASQTLFYPNANITVDKWYHFVGIYDGSKLLLYVNGVLIDDSVSLTGSLPSTTSGLFIGTYAYNNSYTFDGKLSNAQIFNSALPATGSNSVETLYNNGSPLTSMSGFTSLVSWWKLNNTTTGIEDAKGSNNGINNGATEYAGFVNKLVGESSGMSQANLVQSDLQTVAPYSKYAMNFLGTDNDYIDCGNSALTAISGGSNTLTTSMTLSTWFKLGSSSASKGLIGFGDLNNNYGGLAVRHESGVFSFLRANQHMVSGGYSFSDTTNWHNMVFVYDPNNAGNCKVYIDSVNVNLSFVNVGSVSLENKKLTIGAYYGLSDTFTGELSNFSTWNTTLTSAQVSEIYNQGLPSNLNSHSAYSNLVSWWQLGENSSFTGDWIFADEKGSNNGDGQNMTEANLTNGVGTTANGVSSGMSEGNLVGEAPYSTANALSTNMVITSRVSGVSDAAITTGGTGYVTGTNIATTGGSGTNCTINITTVSGGVITAITINNGGSNYVIGDVLTISGGNGNATITVSGLNTP